MNTYKNLIGYSRSLFPDEVQKLSEILSFIVIYNSNERLKYSLELNRCIHETCPFCDSYHFVKNGHYSKNKQRYLCKACGKTFNNYTNTFLADTKLSIETWDKYLLCLVERKTLPQTAEELSISVVTAFEMRHKIVKELERQFGEDLIKQLKERMKQK